MIDVRQLRLTYGESVALDGVDIFVADREMVALVGASGSGKSSLLHCMSGLLAPTAGTVEIAGHVLSEMSRESLVAFRRRHLGFVFQFAELVPELTLRENIALPLELNGVSRRAVRSRTDELLEQLGLGDRAGARPAQVSGGQAQRAAVARAVAHSPAVLFADEPTGALDSTNADVVLELLVGVSREAGSTLVLVTHDERVAKRVDRSITMSDGRVQTDVGSRP